MPTYVPLNVRVQKDTARAIRGDAKRLNKKVEGLADKVLTHFYATTDVETRKRFFATLPIKRQL